MFGGDDDSWTKSAGMLQVQYIRICDLFLLISCTDDAAFQGASRNLPNSAIQTKPDPIFQATRVPTKNFPCLQSNLQLSLGSMLFAALRPADFLDVA